MFKKIYYYGCTIIFFMAIIGCSQDQKVLAEYKLGTNGYTVKIADAKNDFITFLTENPNYQNNTDWYKNTIFDKYIYPSLVQIEEMNNGLTNIPKNKARLDFEYSKQTLMDLYRKGGRVMTDELKKIKIDVARASQILITVSKDTNIGNNITRKLSTAEYNALLQEKEKEANTILQNLKASKNPLKDFISQAKLRSEDQETAKDGGNLGYVTYNMKTTNIINALFNAKKIGLLDQIFQTEIDETKTGLLILYITATKVSKIPTDIAKMDKNKNRVMTLMTHIRDNYLREDCNNHFKELYTADIKNNTIKIGNKVYYSANINPDENIFTIFNKPYNWKTSQDIILLFVPMFTNNTHTSNFVKEMRSLKDFSYYIELARNAGKEKNPEELQKLKDEIIKGLASFQFNTDINLEIERLSKTMPNAAMEFYKANKSNFIKDENGNKTIKPFNEAKDEIVGILQGQMMDKLYGEWRNKMIQKYNVVYSDKNINDLISLVKGKIKKQTSKPNK